MHIVADVFVFEGVWKPDKVVIFLWVRAAVFAFNSTLQITPGVIVIAEGKTIFWDVTELESTDEGKELVAFP